MKIFVLYSCAGEGHKKIAEAAIQELERQNLGAIHGFDAFEKTLPVFRDAYPAVYFYLVKYATQFWSFLYHASDYPLVARLLVPFRRLWNRFHSIGLRKYLREEKPDIMIVTHFYAAEVIASAKLCGEISGKLITIITDAMPHAFWINDGTDYYWVMCEENKKVLMQRGVSENCIRVGGIPVRHEFAEPADRRALRQKHGLQPDRFTILFTSGSFGLGPTEELLKALEDFKDRIQAAVVCGRNQALYDHLTKQTWQYPVIVTGFTDVMHEWMSVADIMIAKSGGSTMCEGLAKTLPMLISAPIPGQETRNRDWLFAHQAAVGIESADDVKNLVRTLLSDPKKLTELHNNIQKIAKPAAAADLTAFVSQISKS